jgi:hypothetical protein
MGIYGRGVFGYTPKGWCERARRIAFNLRYEAVAHPDAVVLGVVRLCMLASRNRLNGAETERVDPAVKAHHGRYDVDRIHTMPLAAS